MKSISIIFLFLVAISCASKPMDDAHPTVSTEVVEMQLDLEDHLYKLEGEWYRWGEAYSDCAPTFHVEYIISSWEEGVLHIKHCEEKGTIDYSTLQIANEHCEDGLASFSTENEDGMSHTTVNIIPNFNSCVLDTSDKVFIQFNFSF